MRELGVASTRSYKNVTKKDGGRTGTACADRFTRLHDSQTKERLLMDGSKADTSDRPLWINGVVKNGRTTIRPAELTDVSDASRQAFACVIGE